MTNCYKGIPVIMPVEIISRIDVYGNIFPLFVVWRDGRRFSINSIRTIEQSFTPDGDCATCYECIIEGHQKNLYMKNGRWFVIIDEPFG